MTSRIRIAAMAILPAMLAGPATAAEESGLKFEASAGYLHDSNVSLSELDTNLGEADNALLLDLGIDGVLPLTDDVTAKASYGFSHVGYAEFSEFDTAIHRLQGDLNWRVASVDAGLSLRQFAARLDDEPYLDIRQVSPSLARLFGETLYLRGAYTAGDKSFSERAERDATSDAFDVDAYWLLDGMRRYVAVGYRIEREDAVADEFDYDGGRAKLTYGHELGRLPLSLQARVELENRDYDNVDETLGGARRDRRFRAGITASVPLAEYFGLEFETRYADFRSNLAAADYDETLYGVNLRASFR